MALNGAGKDTAEARAERARKVKDYKVRAARARQNMSLRLNDMRN
jgi:hypothetical protein